MTESPDLTASNEFLTLLDEGSACWTFQTFDDFKDRKMKAFARVLHGSLERHQDVLSALNQAGAGVFVAINEVAFGKRRTAANIERVRALFVDLDGAPLEPVLQAPLAPTIIVESSPRRYHTYWTLADCPLELFRPLQQFLAQRFSGDPACCDLPRVMRLPGFLHCKADLFQTHIIQTGPGGYTLEQFQAAFQFDPEAVRKRQTRRTRKADQDASIPASGAPLEASERQRIEAALQSIPADDYQTWINVGMALHSTGAADSYEVWRGWSATSPKFDEAVCLDKWQSFNGSGITLASLFGLAKDGGWRYRPDEAAQQVTTVVHCQQDSYDVYIGRANPKHGLPESVFANPFRIGKDGTREEVIAKFEDWHRNSPEPAAAEQRRRLPELEGKRLGCWCKPEACHGDVLIRLLKEHKANQEPPVNENAGDNKPKVADLFTVNETGVWRKPEEDGEAIWICSELRGTARTRDSNGGLWGYLLTWKDPDGTEHNWPMPGELFKGSGEEYRGVLLDGGLLIAPGTKARNLLSVYIQTRKPKGKARCTDRLGWHGNVFVLPDRNIGQSDERLLYQTATRSNIKVSSKGPLKDWQENVSSLCAGNSRLVLAVSTALASPLLELTQDENGGVHFTGSSSSGVTVQIPLPG